MTPLSIDIDLGSICSPLPSLRIGRAWEETFHCALDALGKKLFTARWTYLGRNFNQPLSKMRKRNDNKNVSSSAQATPQHQRKTENAPSWKPRGLFILFVILVLVPFTLIVAQRLLQHLVYTHRLKVPFFTDLSQPADFSQNHTINMYLTSEQGISLGVWHTVPASKWREAQGKGLAWYESTISDGSPVFIYLHGNTGTRGASHRVGTAKVLSALDYHAIVLEYRGFGDSSGEPTEVGLTTDALHVYNWVKERSGSSPVILWGHSLGTGVATNTAVKLLEQGIVLDGIILEAIFNMAEQKLPRHIFSWYYWKFPGMGYFFREPWAENKIDFPNEDNLRKMRSPILFLHSEDDQFIPIGIAQRLYKVAVSAQNAERVKLVTFEGSLGYLHNGLYKDPRLPDIIRKFILSV
ncbi:monoacylglycerol lipase ABHD12-like [Dunckerocampus dactyliophorus]|uniref:monoacylglycerol lipase ABHD12-like n=1 Tax=Dunckerocampus dactyliophorus TaxID=161453 RepID=UPI0024057235|nr:monoacylglycerol lipase ABHD12-like [Dunckerocampus dactyliophorus]